MNYPQGDFEKWICPTAIDTDDNVRVPHDRPRICFKLIDDPEFTLVPRTLQRILDQTLEFGFI